MIAADFEVDRVVPGRDLQRARAELRLDPLVGDHRHATPDDRHDDLLADSVLVPRIVRVDRHGDVGEDRRRTHRRDRDRPGTVDEGIPRVRQRVVHLDVLDLEV